MKYFEELEKELRKAIDIAQRARDKGLDPVERVEILPAKELADRVESLLQIPGLAKHIKKFEDKFSRERLALEIGLNIAMGEVKIYESKTEALEDGVRAAVAILTEGVVSAPLEGIARVEVARNDDGSDFVRIYYAGPIRSAGGTAQALSVLVADYIRRHLGIDRYKPRVEEIERCVAEIPAYKRRVNLQYLPTEDEIRAIVSNCPICIDGEGTEDEIVEGFADLDRISTPKIRGGMALVIAEGIALKARKLKKYVSMLGLDGWEFLDMLVHDTNEDKETRDRDVEPRLRYMEDTLAGRPVFSHPMSKGGFRLRYGRSRNTGLAAVGIHPGTMGILFDFLATGTQMKLERPGKAGAVAPVDSIDGPTVLLDNGDVVRVESYEQALKIRDRVVEILDVGEILISFGEFIENNHPLMPAGYSEEWWREEVRSKGGEPPEDVNEEGAWNISMKYGVPLHPKYTFMWQDLSTDDILFLREFFSKNNMKVKYTEEFKRVKKILETLLIPHKIKDGTLFIEFEQTLLKCLGIDERDKCIGEELSTSDPLELVSRLSGVKIKNRAPVRIGARMGRPEKSKKREMQPPPNVLFPLGNAGGRVRLFKNALQNGGVIEVEIRTMMCPACKEETFLSVCPSCGTRTVQVGRCPRHGRVGGKEKCPRCGSKLTFYDTKKIDLKSYYASALKKVGEANAHALKGVIGLTSTTKTPEPIEKGILRAKHGLAVFKDGTIRYDMTDLPLTHFKPDEINVDVETLKKLGYHTDINGEELKSREQMLELKVQDIVVSEDCIKYMFKVSKFIDELLEKVYGLEPYYNANNEKDMIGQLVIGLAPHTSAGVLGRIIGYTSGSVCYAHPFFHAAKRRNCDGDEDSVILLLDGLLNFSKSYLPDKRGGKMDAPLVLTTRIDPHEIDSEAHNIEVVFSYPLEVYERAEKFASSKEVENLVETVRNKLDEEEIHIGYTHPTHNIFDGPLNSAYKVLESMMDKMEAQLLLAKKLRCVNERDVAERILNSHFIPDLLGNLREFSKQGVRCVKCNTKFRRPPLKGVCPKCGGRLILMVHEGSVRKYLEASIKLAKDFNVSPYTKQRIEMIIQDISDIFENYSTKQKRLFDFM